MSTIRIHLATGLFTDVIPYIVIVRLLTLCGSSRTDTVTKPRHWCVDRTCVPCLFVRATRENSDRNINYRGVSTIRYTYPINYKTISI